MTDAALARIALLPSDLRGEAIDELVELLVRRGLNEAELAQLERQVRHVNASLAEWARPH